MKTGAVFEHGAQKLLMGLHETQVVLPSQQLYCGGDNETSVAFFFFFDGKGKLEKMKEKKGSHCPVPN